MPLFCYISGLIITIVSDLAIANNVLRDNGGATAGFSLLLIWGIGFLYYGLSNYKKHLKWVTIAFFFVVGCLMLFSDPKFMEQVKIEEMVNADELSEDEHPYTEVGAGGAMMWTSGIFLLFTGSLEKKYAKENKKLKGNSNKTSGTAIPAGTTQTYSRISNQSVIVMKQADLDNLLYYKVPDVQNLSQFSMSDVDAISAIPVNKEKGTLFENYCARLLVLNGFSNVQVVGGTGDLGADIIAWKGRKKWVVQCKCYQSTVPYQAYQQTLSARITVGASEAALLTNSHFSKQTLRVAPEQQIYLWDRGKLQQFIDNANEVLRKKNGLPVINTNEKIHF